MSNGRVSLAVYLSLFGEVLINMIHGGNDSGKVGRTPREKFSSILEDLKDERWKKDRPESMR